MSRFRRRARAFACAAAVAGGALATGAAGFAAGEPADSLTAPPAETLAAGEVREDALAGGESRRYRLSLAAGRYLRVTVEQRGVDVEIVVRGPAGDRLGRADTPTGRFLPEILLVPVYRTASYELEIRAFAGEAAGRFRVETEELAAATPVERRHLEAELAESRGAARLSEGDPEALGAEELLRRALDHWRGGKAARRGRLAYLVAEAASRRGRRGEAVAALEEAVDAWRAAGDRWAEVWTRRNLGLLRLARGEPRRALEVFREALALLAGTPSVELEAEVENGLGGASHLLAEDDRALPHYRRALELFRQLERPAEVFRALNSLGVSLRSVGEPQRALEHYLEARTLLGGGGDPGAEGLLLHNIGTLYLALGEPERARTDLELALVLLRRAGDGRGEGVTLDKLGLAFERLGDTAAALEHYRAALARRRETEDRRGEAVTLDHLGTLLGAGGDLAAANEALEAARSLLQAVGDRAREGVVLRHLAEVRLRRGAAAEAEALLRQALELHRGVGDIQGEAAALAALGRTAHSRGRLREALGHLEASLELVESLRSRVGDPELRASFLAAKRRAYGDYTAVLMALHRREPGVGWERRALAAGERARARSLVDLLDEAEAAAPRRADPELLARRRALRHRLAVLAARRLSGGATDPIDPVDPVDPATGSVPLEVELERVLSEIEGVERRLAEARPARAAVRRPRTLTAAEVQALLDPETVLLEIALGEERSFAWGVTEGEILAFELPPRREIERAARRLYEQWSTLAVGEVVSDEASGAPAARLSRWLLRPLGELLGRPRLVVVADGALHYLPFAALPHPDGSDPLLLTHEVVHLPSASALAVSRRTLAGRAPAPRTLAVLADPIFSSRDPRIAGDATAEGSSPGDLSGFPRLAASRREAEALAALVPEGERLVALGSRARRELVTSGALAGFRHLHFATHGVLDAARPALSGLVLSGVDAAGRPLDGLLGLRDIYDLELTADLVVLSGCRTALGREIHGEGLVGLTRGFLSAGAAGVVASLWQVRDRAAAELMERFYRYRLIDGRTAAAALRRAQIDLRRQRRFREPYYWAVFLYQGDWR